MRSVCPNIVPAWERLAYLAAAVLQSRDVALSEPAHRPGFGGIWACGCSGSPKQGRCASFSEHRPVFGEFHPFGRRNPLMSAQDPAFGEIRPSGQGMLPTFPQVRASALLVRSPKPGRCAPAFLQSRDVAPEPLVLFCSNPPTSAKPERCVARARTTFRLGRIVAMRGGIGLVFCAKSRLGRDWLVRD